MKVHIFAIAFIISFLINFVSCSNKPKRSRKPVAQITIKPSKKNFSYGDSLSVFVQIKIRNGELAYASLYFNNKLVKKTKELMMNYSIPSIQQLGKHSFKVIATKTDSVRGINFKSFQVISDIEPEQYTYEVVNSYPHNTGHFTQGLEIYKNQFYESTGEHKTSGIYRFDLNTGDVLQSYKLEDKYFGEGITILEDKIYQLTYKAQKGFIYDVNTFARIDSFTFDTPEGWGLTNNGQHILKTDGSEFIHFIDPKNMQVVRKIQVYDNKEPVKLLNELEYHEGVIYSNIWTTNFAVKIDPENGKVLSRIDFNGLLPVMHNPEERIDVLNGIAIHPENGKMYITGKLWPKLFEVKLIKKQTK